MGGGGGGGGGRLIRRSRFEKGSQRKFRIGRTAKNLHTSWTGEKCCFNQSYQCNTYVPMITYALSKRHT